MPHSSSLQPPDKGRFDVPKSTLWVDTFMTRFIRIGGIGIILAVFGIFFYILSKVVPLFQGAELEEYGKIDTGIADAVLIGADNWSELPFLLDRAGVLHFVDLQHEADGTVMLGQRGIFSLKPDIPEGATVSALDYQPKLRQLVLGFEDGRFLKTRIAYEPRFSEMQERTIHVTLEDSDLLTFGDDGRILDISYYSSDKQALAAGILQESDGALAVRTVRFSRQKSLFGTGEWKADDTLEFTASIEGNPLKVLINGRGDSVLLSTDTGHLYYFAVDSESAELVQQFRPFEDQDDPRIGSMHWLLGNESLVLTSRTGLNRVVSYFNTDDGTRRYVTTKTLEPSLGAPATVYSKSLRNRAYLIGSGSDLSLRYATTETLRWSNKLAFEPVALTLGNRYDSALMADADGGLHVFSLKDPHPEAGLKAFFGKIWYEGRPEPEWNYQTSAADEETEVKISMMPLIFGSIKGALYAMIFAVPIALLAAIYTSQFLRPEFRRIVKPTMEIMASIPSVVLGFLGALWLAPIIENHVPSVFIIILLVPVAAFGMGMLWEHIPLNYRHYIPHGYEFLVFIPILLLISWLGWQLGPVVDRWLFASPELGIQDFRQWWQEYSGVKYEARNSLLIGIIMGFAVIPIIFTITEDAMSNVPQYLSSASLALGASRWQTAWRIVVPTASAGIFSALMIGLGRAVGETLIMVMCTGNTPIMDWNLFNGMRTLAANIAVELPEAPKDSTHYRSLFLGALLLFVLTFFINTIAEIARNRLRERFKTVG